MKYRGTLWVISFVGVCVGGGGLWWMERRGGWRGERTQPSSFGWTQKSKGAFFGPSMCLGGAALVAEWVGLWVGVFFIKTYLM
jgi:hypothetical protein